MVHQASAFVQQYAVPCTLSRTLEYDQLVSHGLIPRQMCRCLKLIVIPAVTPISGAKNNKNRINYRPKNWLHQYTTSEGRENVGEIWLHCTASGFNIGNTPRKTKKQWWHLFCSIAFSLFWSVMIRCFSRTSLWINCCSCCRRSCRSQTTDLSLLCINVSLSVCVWGS